MLTSKTLPNNYTIEVHYDHDDGGLNPRVDYDNAFTMVCHHRRYDLGDKNHDFKTPQDILDYIKKEKKNLAFVGQLYLYDHSGITISMSPFSCPWDSGQVGIIFITKEKAIYEFGEDYTEEQLLNSAKGEVSTYDLYLRGSCYGYIVKDPQGEEVDSCWGYLMEDYDEIIEEQVDIWKDQGEDIE